MVEFAGSDEVMAALDLFALSMLEPLRVAPAIAGVAFVPLAIAGLSGVAGDIAPRVFRIEPSAPTVSVADSDADARSISNAVA